MTPRKDCANPVEAARAGLAAVGEELDRLEATPDELRCDELEQQRQALYRRWAAARRRLEAAEIEEAAG